MLRCAENPKSWKWPELIDVTVCTVYTVSVYQLILIFLMAKNTVT